MCIDLNTPLPSELFEAVREARSRARRLSQEADESDNFWDLELKIDPCAIAWCYGQEELADAGSCQPQADESSIRAGDRGVAPLIQIPANEAHPIRGHDAECTVLVISGDDPLSTAVRNALLEDKITTIHHTFMHKTSQLIDEIRWRAFTKDIMDLTRLGKFKGAIIIHTFTTFTSTFRTSSSPYGFSELTPSQKTAVRMETAAAFRLLWILEHCLSKVLPFVCALRASESSSQGLPFLMPEFEKIVPSL